MCANDCDRAPKGALLWSINYQVNVMLETAKSVVVTVTL